MATKQTHRETHRALGKNHSTRVRAENQPFLLLVVSSQGLLARSSFSRPALVYMAPLPLILSYEKGWASGLPATPAPPHLTSQVLLGLSPPILLLAALSPTSQLWKCSVALQALVLSRSAALQVARRLPLAPRTEVAFVPNVGHLCSMTFKAYPRVDTWWLFRRAGTDRLNLSASAEGLGLGLGGGGGGHNCEFPLG